MMLETMSEITHQRENLAELQVSSIKIIALAAAGLGYLWFVWIDTPGRTQPSPASAWGGVTLLTLCGILGYVLSRRHLRLAAHTVVWGQLATVTCIALAYPSPVIPSLFVLPVIVSSVLLQRRAAASVAATAVALLLTATLSHGKPLASMDTVIPVSILVLVALTSWLSARNLYTALDWTWHSFERASRNEQIARARQADLRRALKALDEATYRLERTNHMLTLARDQAEEARQLKQAFAQTISHELRTPLNLIVGFTEVMTQSPQYYGAILPSSYLRDLHIVHRNARHLQDLVNDVLDLARIDAAQMNLLPEEIDPAALVRQAVHTARALVETRGLDLRMHIGAGLPRMWLDPVRIRQVLFNLLNNAARFTESGSITVSVESQDEEVHFSVADTGVGIPADKIPHLFEEFQQIDYSPRRRHEGAGLGLAISQRFVQLHGGRIWVESRLGEGTTFHFSLPLEGSEAKASADRVTLKTSALPGPPGEEHIALVVTRSPSAATLLGRYLRGCRTVAAQDLEQARQAASRLLPQVVVVDMASVQLAPGGLVALAQEWALPRTPFLGCSLPGEEPMRRQLAVDAYLMKPVSQQSVMDTLRYFGDGVDTILVVDDDRDFVQLLSRMLEGPLRHYRVLAAHSGEEALEQMRVQRPDLVLLDLGLPGIDGFQVIESIRSTSDWQQIPIVVVSARDEIDSFEPVTGSMLITRADGLRLAEVMQWAQKVLDLGMSQRHLSQSANPPNPGLH